MFKYFQEDKKGINRLNELIFNQVNPYLTFIARRKNDTGKEEWAIKMGLAPEETNPKRACLFPSGIWMDIVIKTSTSSSYGSSHKGVGV